MNAQPGLVRSWFYCNVRRFLASTRSNSRTVENKVIRSSDLDLIPNSGNFYCRKGELEDKACRK